VLALFKGMIRHFIKKFHRKSRRLINYKIIVFINNNSIPFIKKVAWGCY